MARSLQELLLRFPKLHRPKYIPSYTGGSTIISESLSDVVQYPIDLSGDADWARNNLQPLLAHLNATFTDPIALQELSDWSSSIGRVWAVSREQYLTGEGALSALVSPLHDWISGFLARWINPQVRVYWRLVSSGPPGKSDHELVLQVRQINWSPPAGEHGTRYRWECVGPDKWEVVIGLAEDKTTTRMTDHIFEGFVDTLTAADYASLPGFRLAVLYGVDGVEDQLDSISSKLCEQLAGECFSRGVPIVYTFTGTTMNAFTLSPSSNGRPPGMTASNLTKTIFMPSSRKLWNCHVGFVLGVTLWAIRSFQTAYGNTMGMPDLRAVPIVYGNTLSSGPGGGSAIGPSSSGFSSGNAGLGHAQSSSSSQTPGTSATNNTMQIQPPADLRFSTPQRPVGAKRPLPPTPPEDTGALDDITMDPPKMFGRLMVGTSESAVSQASSYLPSPVHSPAKIDVTELGPLSVCTRVPSSILSDPASRSAVQARLSEHSPNMVDQQLHGPYIPSYDSSDLPHLRSPQYVGPKSLKSRDLVIGPYRSHGSTWTAFEVSEAIIDDDSAQAIVKFLYLPQWTEANQSWRQVLEAAVRQEFRIMTDPKFTAIQGSVIPKVNNLYPGLFGGVTKGGGNIWMTLCEDAGTVLPKYFAADLRFQEAIRSRYKALHSAGVFHGDVEWRHILAKASAIRSESHLQPLSLDEIFTSYDPQSIRIIDFGSAVTQDTVEQGYDYWQRMCEGEMIRVEQLFKEVSADV
ncbi:hypothetical protein BD324DRAFT_640145 [Kockovaella imperatae]|uniref:Protein kinase domain-containing protein n=1 Tax=Kockovaella imperatae TaxID=4999 RepID=A0A1Y1U5L7_9TREE|nr:hypothetical protein BD324DRAFT_640145 [Kockovaella imperatae]ORX33331.1 hypothetical protein BD324DRAFT_640145 [Kockovaella imperatae]